jgi:hypothetical protein
MAYAASGLVLYLPRILLSKRKNKKMQKAEKNEM